MMLVAGAAIGRPVFEKTTDKVLSEVRRTARYYQEKETVERHDRESQDLGKSNRIRSEQIHEDNSESN